MTQSFSPPSSPSERMTQSMNPSRSDSLASIYSTTTQCSERHLPPSTDPNSQLDPIQTFAILVASDCHLGYADRDEMRRMDSFRSFEEVLEVAKEQDVDFVLLGGDLFHENKPSRFAAQQCANLLRNYCMGERKTSVELVSDPNVNFAHMDPHFRRLNTKDPDLKICMPVFSIHGNHDDPSGSRYLSELDLLHTYGLINYFGKVENIEEIRVEPLLFKKGRTRLAIYGLGNIRDERLHRAYVENRVTIVEPPGGPLKWFNVFILHQNRPGVRGGTNHIPETFLEDWMDLVIWGHEHDPIHIPEKSKWRRFEVLQPGSTVATSMSDGEKKQKYCYRLDVCERKYRTEPLPLKTVRPFVIEDIDLSLAGFKKDDITQGTIRTDAEKYLSKRMERIIRHVEINRGEKQPKEPLVRLRVDFGNIEPLNAILFGQKFVGRVANPRDIVMPVKAKENVVKKDPRSQGKVYKPIVLDTNSIEDLTVSYFGNKSDNMVLFEPKLFTEALREFIHNEDKEAVVDMYEYQKRCIEEYLSEVGETGLDPKHLRENVEKYHTEHSDIPECISDFKQWRAANKKSVKKPPAAASRGRGRGRGATTAAAPAGRGKVKVEEITIEDDDDDDDEPYVPTNNRIARGGRATRSRGGNQTVASTSGASASSPVAPRGAAGGRGRRGRSGGSRAITEYFDVS